MPDEADEFLSKWGGAAAPAAPPDEAEAFLSKWGGTPNLAKRAIDAPVATVKDVRERIFGPQTDYSGQPPVLSGAFRPSLGPPGQYRTLGDKALDAAASAGWGVIEGTTQAADAFGRMGRGIVDVANEGVKAAFGRGFDLGEASDRPITGLADPLMAKAGQTRTLDDARADARAEGHGTALDVGGKIGEKGAGLIAMMAGAQPVAAGLAKAGVVGPLNNVLSFAGGSVLTDPKHPVSAAINGAFSGVGGEMGSALVKAPAAALLARWAGQNGERAAHVLRGLAFGTGMAAAPHVDESGGLHNVLMEGDGLAAAETILLPALLHAGASRESVRAAADSLRADAAKVAADPVRDEPTNVTLWRGRMREAEAEGARLREQAKAEAAAEAATHPNAEPTPGEPVEVTLKRGENRLAAQAAPEAPAGFSADMFHGSPVTDLRSVRANPESRQYDNATSQLGAFFAPSEAEASRYSGKGGRIYPARVNLQRPYEMPWSEFNKFQSPDKGPDGKTIADFSESGLARRTQELKSEASSLRKQLEAEGYDGIVVKSARGKLLEVASFKDVALPEAAAAPREEVIQPRGRVRSADAIEREATGKSLSQLVRAEGGIDLGSAGLTGEVNMLRLKDSGTTGLVRPNGGGKSIDRLIQAAKEAGFDMEGVSPAQFVDRVLADAQGARELSPQSTDFTALGEAALRRRYEQESARWRELKPEERSEVEEGLAIEAEARGEMGNVDTAFDFGANASKPAPPAAPELTLVGRTNNGVGVYQRPGYQPGDVLVTRTDSGRLGAAHPGEVAEARANAAKADKATSAANIDAAVEGIRGGKPARVPKTERGAQAGIGNPLEMAATAASLPRKAFGAIQQGEKAVMERVKTVLSRVAGDIPVGRGLTARDLIGIAKERLEPNVMGREMRNRIDEIGYERAAAKMDSGEAFKGLKVTDPATAERVTDYFEGRATQAEAQAALDPKSHKVLEWAANQRDVNQRELIDLGVLTQEMVDNLKGGGQYATRSYEAVLEGVAEQQGIVSNGKRIPKMWERKDLSPERRQQLGEIRDPRVVIATTLAKQGSLLPMARLFRDVAANPRQASLEGGEGWTREPLPNQPTRYGKLAGMYVRRPFKKWLDSVQGERTATDAVADVVNGWVADWKFGAVSGRPASLLRDVMGNELFGEFSNRSHADLTNLVDDAGAVRIMRSKPGTPEYDLLKRFVEKGVTDGSSFEPDTLKMLEEVTRAPGRNMPEKIKAYVKDKLSAVAHGQLNRAIPGTEVVARVRQLQDAFFRVRALHHDIRKGATVDEAIAQVRLDYPYFGGNVAGAVMRAKGLPMAALRAAGPIPPFLNFMEWGAKWAVRQAINRPATSAALVGGLSALSSAVAKMAGLSDEDRRRMEAAIPKYRRPSLLRPLVGVDDNGNPTVIDLSYVVPMGNELETAIATMKAMTGSSDEIDDDGMRGLPVGPAMALFAQIGMNKKMFSDTPINTSQDPAFGSRTSAPEGRRQMLRYIAEGMVPTVRDVGKFYRAVKGVPLDSKGKIQPDVLLTALDTFAGVKIRTSDVATDRYHSLLGATQIIQEKLRGWEKVQKDPRIDPADLPEREREFAADIMDIYLKTLPFRVKGARNVVEKIQSTMDAQLVVGDLRGETNAAREAANPGGK